MFGFGRKKYQAADVPAENVVDYKKKYDEFYASTQLANKQKEQDNAIATAKLTSTHELTVAKLKNDNELALSQKEFELKHTADERVKTAEDKASSAATDLAVAKKENEMLVKITDLNKDVIDVKELVTNLINKLPNVNITASVGGGAAKQEKSN